MATIPRWVLRYAEVKLPKDFAGKLELNFKKGEGFQHLNVIYGVREQDVQDLAIQ